MNIKIQTFEKLKYIRQIQTSSPTQRKKIKILISLESENYRNNTIEGIKKVSQKFAQIKKSLYLRTAFERKRKQKQ